MWSLVFSLFSLSSRRGGEERSFSPWNTTTQEAILLSWWNKVTWSCVCVCGACYAWRGAPTHTYNTYDTIWNVHFGFFLCCFSFEGTTTRETTCIAPSGAWRMCARVLHMHSIYHIHISHDRGVLVWDWNTLQYKCLPFWWQINERSRKVFCGRTGWLHVYAKIHSVMKTCRFVFVFLSTREGGNQYL
jgi:hypothetical protein